MKNVVPLFCVIIVCLLPATLFAQGSFPNNPPHYPRSPADIGPAHPEIDPHDVLIEKYNTGLLSLDDMRRIGLSVFAIPFNSYDGLGDGEFRIEEW